MGLCSSKKKGNGVWRRRRKEHIHELEHDVTIETYGHLEDDVYEDINCPFTDQSTMDLFQLDILKEDQKHRNPVHDISYEQSTDVGTEEIYKPKHTFYGYNDKTTEQKCLEYREMVRIFKPMIVQNLLIHDILPHLPFLDNHDDIYEEMKQHSQKAAVRRLLSELETCDELGKWQIFMDALYNCGYTYIVDNIRGYKFTNYHYQTQYIKRLTPVIGKMISPPELMPYLMANELLSDTDKDNISCECNNRGDYAGAVLLLDRITRKHGNWYMLFIKALEEANCHEVAANLRIKELMENERVKRIKEDDDDYEEIEGTGTTTHAAGTGTITRADNRHNDPVVENYGPSLVDSTVQAHIPQVQKRSVQLQVTGCVLEPQFDYIIENTGANITKETDEAPITIIEENRGCTDYLGMNRSIHMYMTTQTGYTMDGLSDKHEQHQPFALNTVNRWFAGFVELSLDQWY